MRLALSSNSGNFWHQLVKVFVSNSLDQLLSSLAVYSSREPCAADLAFAREDFSQSKRSSVIGSIIPPVICKSIFWPANSRISFYHSTLYCLSLATFGSRLIVWMPLTACHIRSDPSSDRSNIRVSPHTSLLQLYTIEVQTMLSAKMTMRTVSCN